MNSKSERKKENKVTSKKEKNDERNQESDFKEREIFPKRKENYFKEKNIPKGTERKIK